MANIGAGETQVAYLIKKSVATDVNSQIKDTVPTETLLNIEGVSRFKYRHLSQTEMLYQPISGWLKGVFDKVLFTSETNIIFEERDFIMFSNGKKLRITRVLPQTQHGAFLVNKKPPHILELS
jgi:hypothetical protein